MKKIVKYFLGLLCVTALFLGCAEKADGSCDLVWTLSCLCIATVTGLGIKKMEEAQ